MNSEEEVRRIVEALKEQAAAQGVKLTVRDLGAATIVPANPLAKCNCVSCRLARTFQREIARRN